MERRAFLALAGAATGTAMTGCLSVFADSQENVVLPPQEDQRGESDHLAYPAYGQPFPEFALPNPLTDETVESVVSDRVTLMTAIYATCPAECLIVGNRLAGVQSELEERGRSDDVRFVSVTFDPENDTAEVLRDHGENVGVDFDVGNWKFMRPDSVEEAEQVVTDELGIGFEREGGEFVHYVVTFLVNPDGYVERAYVGELLDIDRLVEDVETVADEYL